MHQWIAIDWDHTLVGSDQLLLPGAMDAVKLLRERGFRVMIHSCNNPDWIGKCCDEQGLVVDAIWDAAGKPVCAAYIDDRAIGFRGDWAATLQEVTEYVGNRPVRR